MDLEAFMDKDVGRNHLLELTVDHGVLEKGTYPVYFQELVNTSDMPNVARSPFIVVYRYKDKNGCRCDYTEIPVDEILNLHNLGESYLI